MQDSYLGALFLGAYGENDELFERVLMEFIRDHVFWRRNFHPEDTPPIGTDAQYSPEYQRQSALMKRELHRLSARLKQSVPFFHPRYIGHMSSDLLMPGLIAQLITTLYNPNNITHEAAPVTVELELEVGLQLARMLGFPADEDDENAAFGHLTCGGTTANYQSLWLARSVKSWPLAARAAAIHCRLPLSIGGRAIEDMSAWELFNLPLDEVYNLYRELKQALERLPERVCEFSEALKRERLEYRGMGEFFAGHGLKTPRVLVPTTAHYSWEKAMKLLGLGSAQLMAIPTQGMRMDITALEKTLVSCREQQIPVLCVVGVLGTTEFGTIDPLAEILAQRRRHADEGLGFWVHVDAAWGGYLASIFRQEDGGLRAHAEVRDEFSYFPSPPVYAALAALSQVDSVTIDPHKLGYLPFGTGAFVCRQRLAMDFVTQDAAYVFDERGEGRKESFREKYSKLGKYIIEGSKPGASAAAAYVTHKVLPLDHRHFGRLPRQTIRNTEYFFDRIRELQERLSPRVKLVIPFEPDCNLITLAINPADNRSLADANRFTRGIFQHLSVDTRTPLQNHQFFGSYTSLTLSVLGHGEAERILAALALPVDSLVAGTIEKSAQDDHIYVLRHTLMNPWLTGQEENDAPNYIDRYLGHLEALIREALDKDRT